MKYTVFLERFVLTVLAAMFGVIIWNPMGLDLTQRITGGIAVVAIAVCVGHTIQKEAKPKPVPLAVETPSTPKLSPSADFPRSQIVLRSVANPKIGHVEEIPGKAMLSVFVSIRNPGPPTNFRILWIQLSAPDGSKNYNARMLADVGKDVVMKFSDGTNVQKIKESQNISVIQDEVISTKIIDAYMSLLFEMPEAELTKIIEQHADLKIAFEDGLGNRAIWKIPNLHFGGDKLEMDIPATILKPKS